MSSTDVMETQMDEELKGPDLSPQRPRNEVPPIYMWLVARRRLALSFVLGLAGFIAILLGWWGVSGTTVVADQLSYIASGGVLGLFLVGLSTVAYWADQRQREVDRLAEIEAYLGAIAVALGLTGPQGPLDPVFDVDEG